MAQKKEKVFFTLCSSKASMNDLGSKLGKETIFPPQWSVGKPTTFKPKMWNIGNTQIVVGWNVSGNNVDDRMA